MSNAVFNKVAGIIGMRGSGKTDYLKGNPQHELEGFFPAYLAKDMKVLILDTIDHTSYRDIPVLPLAKLGGWKKGVYRAWCRPDEMPDLCAHLNTLPSMWNTALVFEDAYKHQDKYIHKSIKDLIVDSKQKNIDIFFMYHCFGWAPKDLFRCVDLIELFKTKDHPSIRKDDMPGYYDNCLKAYNEVMAHPSKFHHKLIDTEL